MNLNATNDIILKDSIAELVEQANINLKNPQTIFNDVTGLFVKIVDTETIYHSIREKFPQINGETRFGEGVEEYFEDLALPYDYDKDGKSTLVPHDSTHRQATYTYAIPPKNFTYTIRKVGLKNGFNDNNSLITYLAQHTAKYRDSVIDYTNQLKKGLLGFYINLAVDSDSDAVTFDTETAYSVGTIVKPNPVSTERAVVYFAIPSTNTSTYQDLVSDGALVVREVVQEVTNITDSTSGEDFIIAVKKAAEDFSFASNKYNLSGARQGDNGTYTLYIKKGALPTLDVKTIAGAFQESRLAMPVSIVVTDDFGGADESVIAFMVDDRGIKLFPTEIQVDEDLNGEAHAINIWEYRKWLPRCSAFTNLRVFKTAE